MRVEQRAATPTAVVRRRTTWDRFPAEWGPMLDEVYALVRAGEIEQDGHNVMVYRDLDDGGVEVEVGVQVGRPFASTGAVLSSELPGGEVAVTVHRGPYGRLGATHAALLQWCATEGRSVAGPRWEIYGDWMEDENTLETEIAYLLG
jgi:effector-binding domain-containing protein